MIRTLFILLLLTSIAHADNSDTLAPAPVSLFTARDLPESEPGKPVWDGTSTHGCGITYFDKWVYVVSQTEKILQFECDPATAKLTYKGAAPLGYDYKDNSIRNVQVFCWIRRTDDGQAKLVIFYGDHDKGVSWYGINKSTGELTPEGKEVPARCDQHNATQLMAPDQQHFCYGGRYLDSIIWYRFGENGAPIEDGRSQLKYWGMDTQAPCIMASPDWKYMYYLMFSQAVRNDPSKDITPQIDTYKIDPKTHEATYIASLELPVPEAIRGKERVNGTLESFSPDGKYTYAIFGAGNNCYYYTLIRDASTGTLTLASPTPATNTGKLIKLAVAMWWRQERFAYTDQGRTVYFANGALERFSRDQVTGALDPLSPLPYMGAKKLIFDPVNGNLFTVGEKIASFKVGANTPAK